MHDDERLKRLKALVARLERLPASPDRDRVLADARARVVDVETGEVTRPMRDVDSDLAAIAREAVSAPRPERPVVTLSAPAASPAPPVPGDAAAVERTLPAEREPRPAAPEPAVADEAADAFDFDDADDWVLNVEDEPLPEPEVPRTRPWTLGLRG